MRNNYIHEKVGNAPDSSDVVVDSLGINLKWSRNRKKKGFPPNLIMGHQMQK
ncbi:hypothetical protein KFK09_028999 [Dendrobium nobile]|uniref:Uncharacterized protein n=1 Tax=Dendrobium nobile TaxID=94219 RepID=A0A8T3A4J4_DENNO|nr:hypothetical protein KFK09_028999 [Dendrobium nobile]